MMRQSSSCHRRRRFRRAQLQCSVRWVLTSLLISLVLPLHLRVAVEVNAYHPNLLRRRAWLVQHAGVSAAAVVALVTSTTPTTTAHAASPSQTSPPILLSQLQEAQSALDTLLQNWERATVDCTFADVPRDLLESKNKQLLLEKASTYALFDKSVSVESCKTTNRIVRDYLGVTGKGPLVGVDKMLKRGLELVDGDMEDLDRYVTEMELFSQYMSKATSLSYTAGTADLDAVNNFAKDNAVAPSQSSASNSNSNSNSNSSSNLEQARLAIVDAKNSLDRLVDMLLVGS